MAKMSYVEQASQQVQVDRPGTLLECADAGNRRIVRIGHDGKSLSFSYSYFDRGNGKIAWTKPLALSVAECKKAIGRKVLGTVDVGSLTSAFKVDNTTFYGFNARKGMCAFAFTVEGSKPLEKDSKGNLFFGPAPLRVRLYVDSVNVASALDRIDLLSTKKDSKGHKIPTEQGDNV